MTDQNDNPVSEESFRLMLKGLGNQWYRDSSGISQVVNILIEETIRLRDQIKAETGRVLTVGDTRTALDALVIRMVQEGSDSMLTADQHLLVEIWMKRLTAVE